MSNLANFMVAPRHQGMKTEAINIRVAEGTNARIDKVLRGGEIRAAFIREAIERELERREHDSERQPSR